MIRLLLSALAFGLVLSTSLVGQTEPATLSAGTPLVVALDGNCPMRTGAPIRGKLVYPVYASNKLVLPKGAAVMGSVVALHSDRARRTRSELGGDFTPFHRPEVHFDRVILTDGSTLPIVSTAVGDGAPIYEAMAPAPSKGGLLRREFNAGLSAARGDIAAFTAPGKGDRLLQFIYARLPYHPEQIDAGTAWTFETAATERSEALRSSAWKIACATLRSSTGTSCNGRPSRLSRRRLRRARFLLSRPRLRQLHQLRRADATSGTSPCRSRRKPTTPARGS